MLINSSNSCWYKHKQNEKYVAYGKSRRSFEPDLHWNIFVSVSVHITFQELYSGFTAFLYFGTSLDSGSWCQRSNHDVYGWTSLMYPQEADNTHDDVIKWIHLPRYWPFVRGIHRSPVNSPHKGQWRGALIFSMICGWTNNWANNRDAGDLRRHHAHYDIIVMQTQHTKT